MLRFMSLTTFTSMKKILVPTDFSKEAENALRVASDLCRKFKSCEIYLLHLLELPLHQVDAFSSHSDLPEAIFFMKIAHKKFEKLMSSEFLNDIKVHEIVRSDLKFGHIANTAKELDIDMIVMGSHGTSGFQEMFIGSNAEKIVRSSEVPVLVIKNNHEKFEVSNFVFASDFQNDNKKTYEQAINFATIFNSRIDLLMVNTASKFSTTKEALKKINNFIENYNYPNQTINIYNDESVEQGILNFSKDISADLIGISTHGRQGIAHFFNGSISEDLVNHAKRPVITFKI